MDYISVRDAADKWGVSERLVQKLAHEGRVEGALRFGKSWMIPKGAEKPPDPRIVRRERGEPYHTGKKEGGGHDGR
jgi:hypothetical protein